MQTGQTGQTGIGLMCGTFDPPHIGHLILAQMAFTQLEIDQVLFLPVGDPTHKTTRTSAEHRLNMTQLAIAGNRAFRLDDTDAARPEPHYTATLLPLIQRSYPKANLWLIMGGDSLNSFPDWYRPLEILSYCRLAVLNRPTVGKRPPSSPPLSTALSNQVDQLNGPSINLSSTWIRKQLRQPDQSTRLNQLQYLLPPNLMQYIEEHQLYRK